MPHFKTNSRKTYEGAVKVTRLLNEYLLIQNKNRSLIDIFLWWERKRITFNIIVLTIWYSCFQIHLFFFKESESSFSKRELILFIFFYNIVYSSFCVLEFLIKKDKKYAPNMFKNGLFICTAIVTIPTLFHLLQAIYL